MKKLDVVAEREILEIIKRICGQQKIEEIVDLDFCPGKFIMSQVLVSIIPEIEIKTGISVPLEVYLFHDSNKNKGQLSIKEAVQKLIKVGKYEEQQ